MQIESSLFEKSESSAKRETELLDFVENAQLGLHWVDANGIIKWANNAEMELLGYCPNEYIGQPISNFHADSHVIDDILQRLGRNEILRNYEARLRSKNGSIRHVLISSSVYSDQGKFIHTRCFTTDITDRKQAETVLVEQARLSALRADIGHFLASNDSEGVILQNCMQAFVDRLHMSFARVWTLNCAQQVLELQASAGIYTHIDGPHARVKVGEFKIGRIAASKQPHLSNDVPNDPEVSNKDWAKKEGMVAFAGYPLILEGQVIGVIAMFARSPLSSLILQDLSPIANSIAQWIKRRHVEAELATNREWLAVTLRSIGDGLIAANKNGLVSYLNPVAQQLTGWTEIEAVNQPVATVFNIVNEGTRKPVESPIEKALRENIVVALANHTVLISKDGREVPVEDSAAPIRDASGFTVGAVMVFYDVSERRMREKEREASLKREQAMRLEAEAAKADAEKANRSKDQFFATLSHELRAPLTPMLGWTKMLLGGKLDDANKLHGLTIIDRNIRAQAKLIEDLLDISRIIAGKLSLNIDSLNLVEVINAAIDVVRPAADAKRIKVEFETIQKVVEVSGDRDRLQQVIWNLLSNAIKFTPKDGNVWIKLRFENSEAELSIADTGEGLDKDFIPHLFERFSQADSSSARVHGGLGIGLSLVKHLIEQHGGNVRAESPGLKHGSTFYVRIPMRAVKGRSSDSTDVSLAGILPDVTLATSRLLVIDDDSDSRDLIVLVLKEAGADVVSAPSVADGLQKFRTHKPHVVVCDLGMPVEDGFCFIRQLREIEAKSGTFTPVLALTAFARDEDKRRCLSAGFQVHLTKPIEPLDLVSAVMKQIAERR